MKLLICTQVVDKQHPILGFFHSWIAEFAKHFSEVHVITLQQGEFDLPMNVHVYSLGKEEGKGQFTYLWRFYTYFWHLFFTVKVDVVFFHMGAVYNILAAPFFFLRRLRQCRFYWWKTHGQINVSGRVALWFVDRVYTAVAESFPVESKKRHVVGHAIDVQQFIPGTEERTIDILFAGRFSRAKRIEQVIAVVATLKASGRQVACTIIGEPVDQTYTAELAAQIEAVGLQNEITVRPAVPQAELIRLYQRARVFFNPSEHDGLDKVILEAMACGAVPLTGNLSFQEMLSPYGLFGPKGDIVWFADRIGELLDEAPAARQSKIAALRELVCEAHALSTLPDRIFTHG